MKSLFISGGSGGHNCLNLLHLNFSVPFCLNTEPLNWEFCNRGWQTMASSGLPRVKWGLLHSFACCLWLFSSCDSKGWALATEHLQWTVNTFLMVSFEAQRFLILIKSNLSLFPLVIVLYYWFCASQSYSDIVTHHNMLSA